MFRTALGVCLLSSLSVVCLAARPALKMGAAEAKNICHQQGNSFLYDCDCAGKQVGEATAADPDPTKVESMLQAALKACPQTDKAAIETHVFQGCESYQRTMRTDHTQYCHCVGEAVAQEFLSAPDIGVKAFNMLVRNGQVKCGFRSEATRVKEMKNPVTTGGPAFEEVRLKKERSCLDNRVTGTWYNCGCFGRKLAEDAATAGENSPISAEGAAFDACPQDDPAPIERTVFESCESYLPSVRQDHEAVCRCTARKTAAAFLAKPTNNLRYREQLRRDAMEQCTAEAGPARKP